MDHRAENVQNSDIVVVIVCIRWPRHFTGSKTWLDR